MRLRLFYVGLLLLPLLLPSVSVSAVSKYEADVTRKWPRVEYGPQTTMYRAQCERYALHLMLERNKLNRNRDKLRWQRSWNTYGDNLLWCQQLPTYDEMYPRQQLEGEERIANDNR